MDNNETVTTTAAKYIRRLQNEVVIDGTPVLHFEYLIVKDMVWEATLAACDEEKTKAVFVFLDESMVLLNRNSYTACSKKSSGKTFELTVEVTKVLLRTGYLLNMKEHNLIFSPR